MESNEIQNWQDALRRLREKQHWRQEDLAKEVNVSKQAVQLWEAGRSMPTGKRAERLKELIRVYFDMSTQDQLVAAISRGQAIGERAESTRQTRSERGHFQPGTPDFHETAEALRDALPEPLKPFAGGTIHSMRMAIPFLYSSPRVIAHAIYGMPGGLKLERVRSAAWRMLVARNAMNDMCPMNRHYFLGLLESPRGSNTYPPILDTEFSTVDVKLARIPTIEELARHIETLEDTKTEAEESLEMMMIQEDISDIL